MHSVRQTGALLLLLLCFSSISRRPVEAYDVFWVLRCSEVGNESFDVGRRRPRRQQTHTRGGAGHHRDGKTTRNNAVRLGRDAAQICRVVETSWHSRRVCCD